MQRANERVGIVAEHDGRDALFGGRDHDGAERALADREANSCALAAAPDCGRRHAEARRRGLVEAARTVEPGVIDRLGDRPGRAEILGRAARPHLSGKSLRRHAGDFLEDAVEVEGAQARSRGEVGKRGRLLGRRDFFAGAAHRLDLGVGRAEPVGAAALARAKTRPLRGLDARKEGDVLALRRPRGATRPAIDAGGLDRDEECAVVSWVAAAHRFPHFVGSDGAAGFDHGREHKRRHRECSGLSLGASHLPRWLGRKTPLLALQLLMAKINRLIPGPRGRLRPEAVIHDGTRSRISRQPG